MKKQRHQNVGRVGKGRSFHFQGLKSGGPHLGETEMEGGGGRGHKAHAISVYEGKELVHNGVTHRGRGEVGKG